MNPDCLPINSFRDEYEEDYKDFYKKYLHECMEKSWFVEHCWYEDELTHTHSSRPSRGKIKPNVGHLVEVTEIEGEIAKGTTGLVVNKRGIEVQIMMPNDQLVWIRRDLTEVIQ